MRSTCVVFLFFVSSCAAPPAPPRSTAPAPVPVPVPTSTPELTVQVRPEAGGIHVTYRSPSSERAFRFDHDGAEIRSDTWKVLDPSLSFSGDDLTSAAPLTGFDLSVAPDSKQRDRVYPALSKVGPGWLIYAPHLLVAEASIPTHLSIDVPPGWTVVGRRNDQGGLRGDGYVFAGPTALVHRGAADVVASPSTPPWLLREVEESAGGTVSFYAKRLGVDLTVQPTIFVSYEPEQNGSFRGDTTPGAIMSLRFYGSGWTERHPAAVEVVSDFLNHETFHFWNAELAAPTEGAARPWLHEGSATYAALLVSREHGTMSKERFLATLNEHFERCQNALADRDLLNNGPKAGNDTYACGTLLQWAVDIGMRKSSKGQRDMLSWWNGVLTKAKSEDGKYSFESAYSLVPPEATKAADILLKVGDAERWSSFANAAHDYGAELFKGRLAKHDLIDALDHVLAIHCGKNRGFSTFPDHVQLDTGTHCGPLSGSSEVDSIAGLNPITEASAMNDKIRALCASKKTVEFGWKGNIVARAPCTEALPPPKLGWQIKEDGT